MTSKWHLKRWVLHYVKLKLVWIVAHWYPEYCGWKCHEVLTPGHFIAGKSLTALPDRSAMERPLTELKQWQLCQNVVNHFWKRWSVEYIMSLTKYTKWTDQKDNISIGDIVILRDKVLFPTYWPLARVINVHPGKDNLIQVVTLKTSKGIYKRPVTKIVVLVPKRFPV